MKAVFGLTVVVCVGLLVYWVTSLPKSSGPSLTIPIAWGNASGNQIEMNAVIGVALAHKSRKNEPGSVGKTKNWDEWVDTHCIIKSASGGPVKVSRRAESSIIPYRDVQQMVGTEEFYLSAKLKPGESCTFDYIIENPKPETYRCQLAAPAQAEKARMYNLELTQGP